MIQAVPTAAARGHLSQRPGVVEIHPEAEPEERNWSHAAAWFQQDRETLRRHDRTACAALELAEAMDRFLGMGVQA